MIFSELYSAYYNTVAAVLREAVAHPLCEAEIRQIVEQYAFGESILSIPPALREERWPLLKADGTTPLRNAPTMPLTTLQKRWLKAIANDPRIRLFGELRMELSDVEPLFTPEDFCVFDKYADGDNYEDAAYRENFQRILDAIRKRYPLRIVCRNRRGSPVRRVILPEYLEYSEKDDKFRLFGAGNRFGSVINLGRIVRCEPYDGPHVQLRGKCHPARPEHVIFELVDRRRALERVLLHFAHFEKRAERLDENRYRITVYYDRDDETELVIRILSFGPMVKVTAPQRFVELIKERLIQQKSCEL